MIDENKLIELRDELYESIQVGSVNSFDLIKVIKEHIKKLDKLIDSKNKESEIHKLNFQDFVDSSISHGIIIPVLKDFTVGIVSDRKSVIKVFEKYFLNSKVIKNIEHSWYPNLYEVLYSSKKYYDKIRTIYENEDGVCGIAFVELDDGRFVVGTKRE